jgi:LysR family transcriptional regulator, glycine cleavage system transcriptional activator
MPRRLPPLKTLPSFEVAARHLSFSAAAAELHLTHGAISRQMKSLEDHLGVRLFRRLGRGLELTAAGTALLQAVRTALDVVEAGASQVAGTGRSGALVVSCLPTFLMRWLIPRLYDFKARHPGIDVRLSASSAPVAFARDGVDVAIRLGTGGSWPQGIEALPFLEEEIGPVCSPELLGRRKLKVPADLRQHALLHTDTRPEAWADWAARRGVDGLALAPAAGTRFEHFYFMLEAAVSGLGVAMAPRPLVAEDLKLGRLVAPLGFVPSGRRYHLIYPAEAAETSKVRTFRAWIAQVASLPVPQSRPAHKRRGGGSE